jgi:hypothetical protein
VKAMALFTVNCSGRTSAYYRLNMDTQTSRGVALVCPQPNEEVKYQRTDNHEHKHSSHASGSFSEDPKHREPRDVEAAGILFRNAISRATLREDAIACGTGTTVCRDRAGRFRTSRWGVVLLSVRVAADGRLGP